MSVDLKKLSFVLPLFLFFFLSIMLVSCDESNSQTSQSDGPDLTPNNDGFIESTEFVTLITSFFEQPGNNCTDGGTGINVGLDNGDGNGSQNDGTLDTGEIDNTFFVCDGAEGPQGPAGAQGPQGPPGANGAPGAQGPQGPAGPAGQQGAQGPAGPAGTAGTDGQDGTDGTNGVDGFNVLFQVVTDPGSGVPGTGNCNGQDAHLVLFGLDLDRDNVLDQGERTNNFIICDGDIGPQGVAGSDGAQGPQGDPGPEGPQGIAGLNGTDGVDGAQGPEGPQGPPGIGIAQNVFTMEQTVNMNGNTADSFNTNFCAQSVPQSRLVSGSCGDAGSNNVRVIFSGFAQAEIYQCRVVNEGDSGAVITISHRCLTIQ